MHKGLSIKNLRDSSSSDSVALRVPGMTLNTTIFPDLGVRTLDLDFADLVVSLNGDPPDQVTHGMDIYVDLLDERLARSADWASRPRIVVAHSFGAMVVLRWLLRHGCAGAADIDGLVLVATTGGPMYDDVRLRVLPRGPFHFRIGVNYTIGLWNTPFVTKLVKRLVCRGTLAVSRVDFSALKDQTDGALDRAGWRNTDWRAMRSFRIAMSDFDVRDELASIAVPTIVLHGTEDAIFAPSVGKRLADAMPNAEYRLVEGGAHGLSLTHGGEVVQAVEDLLGEQGAKPFLTG